MKIRYYEYEYKASQSANRIESNAAPIYAPVHEINDKTIEKPDREHKGYVLKNTSDTAFDQIDSPLP